MAEQSEIVVKRIRARLLKDIPIDHLAVTDRVLDAIIGSAGD
jgi:hypothetical protein